MRPQLLAALLALTGAGRLTGQDRPAEIIGTADVRYPEVLRSAGLGGVVRALVVILPGDTLASGGVQVVSAPHRGFNNAVLEGLRHWTYRARMRGGFAIPETLGVELTFDQGPRGALTFGPSEIRGLSRDSAGVWRATIAPIIVRGRGVPLTGARRDSAGIAAARYLARQLGTTAGGGALVACVTMHSERGVEPLTAAELAALQTPGVAIVDPRRCPPTFTSMAYVVDRVIPPGSDPSRLVVLGAREYAEGWVVVRVEARYGNGKNGRDCILSSTSIGVVTECTLRESWVY